MMVTSTQTQIRHGLKGLKILFVESNINDLLLVEAILKRAGVVLSSNENGNNIVKTLDENDGVDYILLDIDLPNRTGFDVLKDIHQSERYCDIPVLAIAERQGVSVHDLAMLGFVGVIFKPFVFESLARQIARIVRQRQSGQRSFVQVSGRTI